MRKYYYLIVLSLVLFSSQAQFNQIETFTTANGLGNLACWAVLVEPDGTVWVGHSGYISRRSPLGVWDYPSISIAGANNPTVGGSPFFWPGFTVTKFFRQSNGAIWMINGSAFNCSDMNFCPPVVRWHNGQLTAFHVSLNNFPNEGGVFDMTEDNDGNLWFACYDGIVRMNANGNTLTRNPPQTFISNIQTSKIVRSIDRDVNGNLVMITGGQMSLVRIYNPAANTWTHWTLSDAPWKNASYGFYKPQTLVATRNPANNRIYVQTQGGGLYYIDNSDWNSKQRTQIATFLNNWVGFDKVSTNIRDWGYRVFVDSERELWYLGTANFPATNQAMKLLIERDEQVGALVYKRFQFATRTPNITYNNNNAITKSEIEDMSFRSDGREIWVATRHGLERWFQDTVAVLGDVIGIEGVGTKKEGVVGFQTYSSNVLEPKGSGHELNPKFPTISIDSAYYNLASMDYQNLVPGVDAGLTGNGYYQGFALTKAKLDSLGLTFNDIKIRFTPVNLGADIEGNNFDWTYNNQLEKRRYRKWHSVSNNNIVQAESHYEILLGNHVMFKGEMPNFNMGIRYNKYGYMFDSIAGQTDYTPLVPNPNLTQPNPLVVRDAMAQDIGNFGIRFLFNTIQIANNMEVNTPERKGGVFRIYNAFLQKGTSPVSLPKPAPLCGIYTIGQTANADYPNFTAAIADLHQRGIICDVTFQVGKGSYNERLNLGEVDGMHLYTITFDGGEADPQVSYSPAVNDSNYVFAITSTQNLVIKNLKFRNVSSTHGKVFQLAGATKNFKMENCELEGYDDAPTTPVAIKNRFILLTCVDCDSSQFLGNKIYYGTDGFSIAGTRVVVKNNEFQGNKSYAIVVTSATDIEVSKNRILGTFAGNFSGINFGGHPFKINNNQILNTTGNCLNAIYSFDNGVGNAASPSQVYNNEIAINSISGVGRGIGISAGNVQVYHNSIHVMGNNANFNAIQNFQAAAGWTARNNIVVNLSGICFYSSKPNAGANFADSDYNIFFSNSPSPFRSQVAFVVPTAINSLADFQTATGREANSLFINPEFSDNSHLLPLNALANNLGVHLPNLTSDILGRQRPAANRDHGCYEFDGGGWLGTVNNDWKNPANWSNNVVPGQLSTVFISPKTNNPVIDTIVKVKEFFMHHQANLTIYADAGLEVDSLLENQGTIILEADTNGQYARLIQGSVNGGGRIQQEAALFAANNNLRWYHIGVPVVTKVKDLANPGSIITAGQSGSSIYFWDASTGNWISPPDTAASLQPGIGYAVAAGQNAFGNFLVNGFPNKIDVTGDLRSASQPYVLNLGYTQVPNFNTYVSGLTDGWNLLANPYHAVYDMSGQTIAGPYKMIYVWDGTTYKQYNTDLNVGDLSARYLAPLQGFFVRIDSNMAAQGFSFQPSQRVLDRNDQVLKSQQTYPNFQIEITSNSNSQKDQTYFMAHPMATQAFEEEYDAVKLKNAEEHLNLFTYASGDKMAINVLTETQLEQGVRMGLESPHEGQFTLALPLAADVPYEVYVKDDFLKQTIRLDVQDYTFEHKNHYPENRFEVFTKAKTVGIEAHEKSAIYLHTQQGILTLYNLPEQKLQVQILDLQGRVLMQSSKSPGDEQHSLTLPHNLAAGVYLVQIPELRKTFKVLID